MQVICPIRSGKKFRAYVNTMKNAKIFIGINSNSSQVSGGLVGLTEKPVIGVPCENELGNNYLLSTVNMPPGVPVATVGVNNGRNAAVVSGEILSINNPVLLELLEKLKNKKIKQNCAKVLYLKEDGGIISSVMFAILANIAAYAAPRYARLRY